MRAKRGVVMGENAWMETLVFVEDGDRWMKWRRSNWIGSLYFIYYDDDFDDWEEQYGLD